MTTPANHGETLNDQAAAWVARLAAEDASEEDWLALEAWLAADPAHLKAYARAEALWAELDDQADSIAPALASDTASPQIVDFTARRSRGRPTRWLAPLTGIAAGLVVAVVVGQQVFLPATVTYQTRPGETRNITLSDGTTINLNGSSRIKVQMGKSRRVVRMDVAEASFNVAHDPQRPFEVRAGDSRVRDIGTEFNIRRSATSTTVSVRQGIVDVSELSSGAPVARLSAGRELVDADGPDKAQVHDIAPDAPFAWRTGQLIYTGATLSNVAEDLSRRFRTPVRVEGTAGSLPFTGVLVLDDEAAVIRRLEGFLPITDHRAAGAITLTDRR